MLGKFSCMIKFSICHRFELVIRYGGFVSPLLSYRWNHFVLGRGFLSGFGGSSCGGTNTSFPSTWTGWTSCSSFFLNMLLILAPLLGLRLLSGQVHPPIDCGNGDHHKNQ